MADNGSVLLIPTSGVGLFQETNTAGPRGTGGISFAGRANRSVGTIGGDSSRGV